MTTKIGFIDSKEDVNFTDLKRSEYAYVIYDLEHRKNMDVIKAYFEKQGIFLNGRFGSFEYGCSYSTVKRIVRTNLKREYLYRYIVTVQNPLLTRDKEFYQEVAR